MSRTLSTTCAKRERPQKRVSLEEKILRNNLDRKISKEANLRKGRMKDREGCMEKPVLGVRIRWEGRVWRLEWIMGKRDEMETGLEPARRTVETKVVRQSEGRPYRTNGAGNAGWTLKDTEKRRNFVVTAMHLNGL